ncbi:hypothetical protein [Maricaulis sp.]|jgi:hypothetical protein|uniref:hypothetical protein n=1 Tax=Maricaulis sp. TaxID=1486257 RepID=UPI0025F98BA1|nr:hypothetical protein [Maricaulis sp.]MDF1769035.1 hypothetical protein [Maricaulis sp.]
MVGRNKRMRDLSALQMTASTSRVLNLNHTYKNFGHEDEYKDNPLFQCERLNQALIIKHMVRADERDFFFKGQQTVTKVAIPLSRENLRLGAFSFFFEQQNFEEAFSQAIGSDVTAEVRERDRLVLAELARLPSFDPYLLRERLRLVGLEPSARYFDISELDAAKVEAYVVKEISWLVERAYKIDGPEAKHVSNKLARLIMRNERSASLNPLRETLRLDEHTYDQGMFGWKGVLYYKWQYHDLQKRLDTQLGRMMNTRFAHAHAEDQRQLDLARRSIIKTVKERYKRVAKRLMEYDHSFERFSEASDVSAFRGFILRAPELFSAIGDNLAAVQHIASLWAFRQPDHLPDRIEVDDAYDIFRDFAAALGGRDASLGDSGA